MINPLSSFVSAIRGNFLATGHNLFVNPTVEESEESRVQGSVHAIAVESIDNIYLKTADRCPRGTAAY